MKIFLFLFFFITADQLVAQKRTAEVIEAGNIKTIEVAGDEIYKVTVHTAPVENIRIRSNADGEYFNEISLDTRINGSVLFLNSRFSEILQSGYDKLSAHKVLAMEMELVIPENLTIKINSNVASVFMDGIYKDVMIQSKTGSSYLNNFSGNAVINTYDGNIEVTTSNAAITADSRHGKIELPQMNGGSNKIILTSISGNIKVQETK